ncbi:replication initiation protein [Paenibacillus alvei]|uniref:replication initiation protein n=1 Tax=Paenibacillus alvei TaxID=44250 RepID=UPI003D297ED3
MPQSYTKPKGKDRKGAQRYDVDPERFLFNVDTFWYTVDCDNYDDVMDSWLRERLIEGRTALSDGEEPHTISVELEDYENPLSFDIGGGQKPAYAYQLRNADFAFYFTPRRRADDTYPIKVQINQFILWDKKVIGAFLESQCILMELGFQLGNAKGNRIDLCCHSDQFDWKVSDFTGKLFKYPRNVAKDNFPNFYKLNPDEGSFETVEFGDRSRCSARIYNKSIEIKKKKKDYFKEIYEQRGMNPDKVWNVEFELHRDMLKEFIHPQTGEPRYFDDINNLLSVEGLSYLWTWLTEYQFVHNSAFWKALQKGDPERFITTGDYVIRAKDVNASIYQEFMQIRGRLQKFILTRPFEEGSGMNEALSMFYKMYAELEEEGERDWEEEVFKKRQKYHDRQINGLLSPAQKLAIEANKKRKKEAQLLNQKGKN